MEHNNNTQLAEMLLRFYNVQAGTAIRSKNEWNQKRIFLALDAAYDVAEFKAFIREWVRQNPAASKNAENCLRLCVEDFITSKGTKPSAPATEEQIPEAQPQPQITDNQVNYSMGILEQAVIQLISKTQTERIESEIMGQVQDEVRNFIKSEYGAIERKITTVIDGKEFKPNGCVHKKFDTVLKFVANNEPVFLTGPAGSGKNHLCKQVAEALGLKFYFTNAVTQEYKLTGFTDAMGNYQPTQFYEAFKNGGLFMLDEMDASIPEVLVILNAAIANRYFDFPAPIGYVEAHKDFRVIAAGNTTGQGASYEYVGRNQLDAASLDRFALVEIDYDMGIETQMAQGDMELLHFCREYRNSALKAGQQVIVSYRAISRLAKMLKILDTEEAIETCLTKGMEKDSLNIILKGLNDHSKYRTALEHIASRA